MSESWRIKRYYPTRVLVDIEQILDNPYPSRLVPMSGAEVALVRNLLQYADRRSTFVDAYQEATYLAPSNDQWDAIQAVVSELEAKLMSDCCQDLLDKLQEILDALSPVAVDVGNLDDNLETIAGDWAAALAAWQCACEQTTKANNSARVSIVWPPTTEPPDYITYDRADADQDVPSQAEADACALAQAWYAAGFEFTTERILPAFRFGWDALQQALVAAITVATGGVGIPVAFGVFVTAELLQELLDVAYEAVEADLWNWLVANKQDLVCDLYTALLDGGSTKAIWDAVWSVRIDDNPDLSDGEQILLRVAFGALAAATAKVAKEQDTAWYQSVVTPGYCSVCETGEIQFVYTWPPCPGDGWTGNIDCGPGVASFKHGKYGQHQESLEAPEAGTWDTVTYDLTWRSCYGSGWTVGNICTHYWNGSGWTPMHTVVPFNNTQPAGTQNVDQKVKSGLSEPGGRLIMVEVKGQDGQYESNPHPLMLDAVTVTFSQS